MNLFKLTLPLSALICLCAPCMAESNPPTQHHVVLVKTSRGSSEKRPKAPDRQQVTCAYDGEVMSFNFAIPEGMATLSITDDSLQVLTYEVDTTPLEVYVTTGALSGIVYIELESEKGNTFSGTIE